jgi:hypothetical protein
MVVVDDGAGGCEEIREYVEEMEFTRYSAVI